MQFLQKNKITERLNLLRNDEDSAIKKNDVILFDKVWDFYIDNRGEVSYENR